MYAVLNCYEEAESTDEDNEEEDVDEDNEEEDVDEDVDNEDKTVENEEVENEDDANKNEDKEQNENENANKYRRETIFESIINLIPESKRKEAVNKQDIFGRTCIFYAIDVRFIHITLIL